MEHVYKFVKNPEYVGPIDKAFTHYWNNSSINFFDDLSTEEYLAKYYPNYHWVKDDELGINKTNTAYATLTIANWEEPVIFVKFEDESGSEIPSYYFATNPNSQTTPTEEATHTVFQLELDLWATIGWRFNKWLKEGFDEDLLAFRKMCDRFIFNSYLGYSLNYQLQPYLMQTARYAYPLIKSPDERSLTLNEWLYINSGEQRYKTLESWSVEWYKWLQQPWAAPIYVSGNWPGLQGTTEWLNYFQNAEGRFLPKGFNDADYNSNGKYKWFVIKTGNNSNVTNANNPVFPNINKNGGIPIKKGKGNTPFFTIPVNTFTYKNNDKFEYDADTLSYVISKTYKGTLGTVPTGSKAIFDFTGTIFDTNYIQLYILNKETSYFESTWIDNNLADMPKQVEIDSFSYGVEYDICEFDTINVKYSQHINLSITPILSFILNSDGTLTFNFRLYTDNDLELGFTLLDYDITIKNDSDFHNKEFKLFSQDQISGGTSQDPEHFFLSGEELLLIPIKKGKEGYDFIHLINSDNQLDETTKIYKGNVILSSNNVLGMPVNDIPPSVLAMALRNYAQESKEQPIGDILSARKWSGSGNECPLSLVDLVSTDKYDAPSILNSLDYIPVNVAMSPQLFREYNIIGGTSFFNSFYDLLTNEYLTNNTYDEEGNLIHGGNTLDAEPLLYSPQFWQWVYLIDGSHRLVLTPDMLDFDKFLFKDWTVRLNVNMTDTTHYKLDISDINSETYPFTKSQSELISVDMITHPYSTEGFNNYMAYNQYTQETSKNAKDVQNYWAQKNLPIYQASSIIGGLGGGIASGAAVGGIWGAIAGGVGGIIGGGVEAITMKAGLENKINMVNELWDNQWNGTFSNLFSQSASLNPNGFGSGSLIYSNVKKSKSNAYETFRTFTITDIAKKEIWNDISVNGYIFRSQCKYKDYDNRKNFNIVNFNFDNRDNEVNQFLKERIGSISTTFSQQNFIDWYKLICKTGIRLFKKDLSVDDTDTLIETNIENNYVRPYIPISGYAVCNYNLPKVDHDNELDNEQVLSTNYSIVKSASETNTYYLEKKNDKVTKYSIEIPLTYFGTKYYGSDARAKFMNDFSGLRLNNDKSQESLYDKKSGKMFDSNIVDINYSSENILFDELELVGDVYKTTKPIKYDVFTSDNDIYAKLIKLQDTSTEQTIASNAYNNGWLVNVEIHTDKIVINAEAFSKFRFNSNKDITNWKVTKALSYERSLEPSDPRVWKYPGSDIKRMRYGISFRVEGEYACRTVSWYGWNIPSAYNSTLKEWQDCEWGYDDFSVWARYPGGSSGIQKFAETHDWSVVKLAENENWQQLFSFSYIELDSSSGFKTNFKFTDKVHWHAENLTNPYSPLITDEDINIDETIDLSFKPEELEEIQKGKNKEWTFVFAYQYVLTFQLEYNKANDEYVLKYKNCFARYSNDEQVGSHARSLDVKNLSLSRVSGVTPTYVVKSVWNGQNLKWSQENKLNSLIFPKTSLINEKSSYILSNKKK